MDPPPDLHNVIRPISVLLDPQGEIMNLERGTRGDALDEWLAKHAHEFKFSPALEDGRPAQSHLRLVILFISDIQQVIDPVEFSTVCRKEAGPFVLLELAPTHRRGRWLIVFGGGTHPFELDNELRRRADEEPLR
jgi:hypothetical protein